MAVKIGINGFGRIGRAVFRILSARADIEVTAINDLFENEQLAYLLQFDTVMGRFKREIRHDDEAIYVDGTKTLMTAQRDPAEIGWGDMGVDFVVEATGVFRNREPLENEARARGYDRSTEE